MKTERKRTSFWRDVLHYPIVYLGLGAVALSWMGAFLLISTEQRAARDAVSNHTANLARAFEENVVRTVRDIDRTLLWLRNDWLERPSQPWSNLFSQAFVASDTTLQWAYIDKDGWLLASSVTPGAIKPINLADRLHFKVHADAEDDFLYISQPVLGRASKKWSVQLTRRVQDADGRFVGVLVASFDPNHFSQFYEAVSLGSGGTVILVGLDGVVRAGGGEGVSKLGKPLEPADLLAELRRRLEGTIELAAEQSMPARIASFRRVRAFPLAVVVMADEAQPDSSWMRNQPVYLASAGGFTLVILLTVLAGIKRSRRLAETRHQLAEKSSQLEVALESISEGIMMVDAADNIGVLNRRCAEMLATPSDFLDQPKSLRDLVRHLEHRGRSDNPALLDVLDLLELHENTDVVHGHERRLANGTVLEVRNAPLEGGGFVRTLSDITERHRAEARIVHLARHDPLTGLANRTLFRQELDNAAEKTVNKEAFGLLMIDLDRFKSVNDSWGHIIGDKLLVEVAERLRSSVRAGDIVARLGGDEFAIIVRNVPGPAQLAVLADRICREARKPFVIDGHTLLIGASVGIAVAPGDGKHGIELLQAADIAMYAAKAEETGTYRLFSRELDAEQKAKRQLEAELRVAIEESQFELHYQPIRSIDSNETTAYEALVRWAHPVRGLISPLEFVPVAEDSGLIVAIGNWVLETACREIKTLPGRMRVAVNLSPIQFRDKGLVEVIVRALETAQLPPERLEIEITESALLQNDALTQQHLEALRKLGVGIAMDDFGTGYSSLGYLLSYPFQSIKIDRSFVQGSRHATELDGNRARHHDVGDHARHLDDGGRRRDGAATRAAARAGMP